MQEDVVFTQKWIETAVKKFFGKENDNLTKDDVAKIKYLRIGESFCNDFMIQLSTDCPPEPFVDTDGGDEWEFACITNKDIGRFLDSFEEEFQKNKGKEYTQLYLFGFDFDDLGEESEDFEITSEKWDKFKETIFEDSYYEETENDDEFDKWYDQIKENVFSDISQFCNVEVLRVNGTHFPDFKCFSELKQLRVLELVETCFASNDGIDDLKKLKQLSCWLD